MSCPLAQSVDSLDGKPVKVTFSDPLASGGTPPYTFTCTPPSGSDFPVGENKVTCVVLDAERQANTCTFSITVTVVPLLTATRFLAFGDSLTEGKLADTTVLPNGGYPGFLLGDLVARYTRQAPIDMINKGCSGETAQAAPGGGLCIGSGGGVVRLPAELTAVGPQALLLLEGANDLAGSNGNPAAIPPLISALQTMVESAKNRGVVVFLATLTPTRQGSQRGGSAFADIPPANDQIRSLAANEHVFLVDLYQGLGNGPDPYIDTDGLHPTVQGYQKMADLFFDAIRAHLETTPGSVQLVWRPGEPNPLVTAAAFRERKR